jgi:hypothetical protein
MKVGGISIIFLLGVLNFILVLFQMSSGLRWIRVPLGLHKRTGFTLVISATLHAIFAYLASM